MPEHYPYRGTTHARASQCRSIPMLEHTHVRAYQCWSIPMSEHTNIGAYKRAMLFTTTSGFHSFWDRANHTIPKIAIYSHIAIQSQWVLFQSTDCPGFIKQCHALDIYAHKCFNIFKKDENTFFQTFMHFQHETSKQIS